MFDKHRPRVGRGKEPIAPADPMAKLLERHLNRGGVERVKSAAEE